MSWRESIAVLRERNLARYAAATAISGLGAGMSIVALAFAVLAIGDFSDLGVVVLVREIPIVVLLLAGGVWADRVSRKLILVSCDVVRGSAQVATGVLLLSGHAEVWNLALAQAVFGMATAFSRPAIVGLIQQVAPPALIHQANSVLGLGRSVSAIAGPALGALVVELSSPGWALIGDGVTFGLSALLVLGVRLQSSRSATVRTSVIRDLRDGWGEFRSRTWVVIMVCYFGIFQLTYFPALFVLGPAVAKDEWSGAGAWGAVLALGAVGSVVGAVLAFRIRLRRPLLGEAFLGIFTALVILALAIPAPLVVVAACAFVGSLALGIADPIWFTTLQRHVPEHAISRISSYDWLGSIALNPLGYALIGPLAASIGVGKTLALSAGANMASGLGLLAFRSVRELGSEPVEEPANPPGGAAVESAEA